MKLLEQLGRQALGALLFACGLLAAAAPAQAAIPDLFGVGSPSAARAGAATATANGFEALHYNPAGLAFARGIELTVGTHIHGSVLRSGGETFPITHPLGIVIGAVAPVPVGGFLEGRLTVGLMLIVLPTDLLVVRVRFPEEAQFVLYDNTTQRLVAQPGLAVKIMDGLSVGLSIDGFAGLGGSVVATESGTRAIDPTLVVTTPATASVHVGVRYEPLPFLSLGVSYRSPFDVPIVLASNTVTAGFPLNIATETHPLAAPGTLSLGAALKHGPVTVSVDGAWERWSKVSAPFAVVDAELAGGIALRGSNPDPGYHDTVEARVGFEYRFGAPDAFGGALRVGYGLDPTPTPEQTGRTNLLDSTRHIVTAGGEVRFRGLRGKPLRILLHAGAHLLPDREHIKDPTRSCDEGGVCDEDLTTDGLQADGNPGWPSIRGGGAALFGGLQITIGL